MPARVITHDGRTQTVTAWAHEAKCSRATLLRRLDLGWSMERALHTPVDVSCYPTAAVATGLDAKRPRRKRAKRVSNKLLNFEQMPPHLVAQIIARRVLNPDALAAVRALTKPGFEAAYSILYEYGPLTGGELNAKARHLLHGGNPDAHVNLHNTLAPMQKAGLTQAIGRRRCAATGGSCRVYDVTAVIPTMPVNHSAGRTAAKDILPARHGQDRQVPEPTQLRAAIADIKRMMKIMERTGQGVSPFTSDAVKFLEQEAGRYAALPTSTAPVLRLVVDGVK